MAVITGTAMACRCGCKLCGCGPKCGRLRSIISWSQALSWILLLAHGSFLVSDIFFFTCHNHDKPGYNLESAEFCVSAVGFAQAATILPASQLAQVISDYPSSDGSYEGLYTLAQLRSLHNTAVVVGVFAIMLQIPAYVAAQMSGVFAPRTVYVPFFDPNLQQQQQQQQNGSFVTVNMSPGGGQVMAAPQPLYMPPQGYSAQQQFMDPSFQPQFQQQPQPGYESQQPAMGYTTMPAEPAAATEPAAVAAAVAAATVAAPAGAEIRVGATVALHSLKTEGLNEAVGKVEAELNADSGCLMVRILHPTGAAAAHPEPVPVRPENLRVIG